MAFRGRPDLAPLYVEKSNALTEVKKYHKSVGITSFVILVVSIFFSIVLSTSGKNFTEYPLTTLFMVINSIIFTLTGIQLLRKKDNNERTRSKLEKFSNNKDIQFKSITDIRYGNFIQFYSVVYGLMILAGIVFKL
jgi:hypothetical protein